MVKKLEIKIDFRNVTPKPAPKTFSLKFVEAMGKKPKWVSLSFRQEEKVLFVQTTFLYRDESPKITICTSATEELVFAILCAFREDMSYITEYTDEGKKRISTEDENEDLRVEMFKTFLESPYQKLDIKCWRPNPDNPDDKRFCIKFPVNSDRFVTFCLPNYKEMYALYKEARDNNIGNNN